MVQCPVNWADGYERHTRLWMAQSAVLLAVISLSQIKAEQPAARASPARSWATALVSPLLAGGPASPIPLWTPLDPHGPPLGPGLHQVQLCREGSLGGLMI